MTIPTWQRPARPATAFMLVMASRLGLEWDFHWVNPDTWEMDTTRVDYSNDQCWEPRLFCEHRSAAEERQRADATFAEFIPLCQETTEDGWFVYRSPEGVESHFDPVLDCEHHFYPVKLVEPKPRHSVEARILQMRRLA